MEIQHTAFKDLIICKPEVYKDERGYFFESFNRNTFEKTTGLTPDFVQDNQSRSTFGVVRGLHFQTGVMAQAKLVRVLEGEVLDVVVDLRKDQPTFGQSFQIMLTAANRTQLFIPRGFAHGFLTLSETATFFYKCDNYYDNQSERGLYFNDPSLNINWPLEEEDFVLSEKDKQYPNFETLIAAL